MDLTPGALGDYRTINCPNLAPTAQEIAEAVMRQQRQGTGRITFQPDPSVARIVASWPRQMRFERAEQLGITTAVTIDTIIDEYLAAPFPSS